MAISRDYSSVDTFCHVLKSPAFISMNHTALKGLSSDDFVRLDYFEMMISSTFSAVYNFAVGLLFMALDVVDCSGKNLFFDRRNMHVIHSVIAGSAILTGFIGILRPAEAIILTALIDLGAIWALSDDSGNYPTLPLIQRSFNWTQATWHNFMEVIRIANHTYLNTDMTIEESLTAAESSISDVIQEVADRVMDEEFMEEVRSGGH